MIVKVSATLARLRPEWEGPESVAGVDVFVRAGTLKPRSGARTLLRAFPMAAAIAAGVTLVVRALRVFHEPPPLPRRRKPSSIREGLRRAYLDVGERVRYSAEYLRTASGRALELRRGRVVAERRVPSYPGDPSPRQVVTVRWDDDPEPGRLLHSALEPVGKVALPQPS